MEKIYLAGFDPKSKNWKGMGGRSAFCLTRRGKLVYIGKSSLFITTPENKKGVVIKNRGRREFVNINCLKDGTGIYNHKD